MPSGWRNSLRSILVSLDLKSSGKWFVLSALIGIVAGLGAIGFQVASQTVMHFTLAQIAGYTPREPAGEHSVFQHEERALSPWLIVAVMAGGGRRWPHLRRDRLHVRT
jgi:CIC family chloride channel protein